MYMRGMTFPEYLQKAGETPYAFYTKHNLRKDGIYLAARKRRVRYETAKLISDATGGEVTISEIMD
jgi:hypothetical protein